MCATTHAPLVHYSRQAGVGCGWVAGAAALPPPPDAPCRDGGTYFPPLTAPAPPGPPPAAPSPPSFSGDDPDQTSLENLRFEMFFKFFKFVELLDSSAAQLLVFTYCDKPAMYHPSPLLLCANVKRNFPAV